MERVIFFSMQLAPEHRQEALDALIEHGRLCVAQEPGTLRFDVLEDNDDPNRLYLYEAYADEAAFQAHLAGESHKRAAAVLAALRDRGHYERDLLVRMHSLFAAPHAGTAATP